MNRLSMCVFFFVCSLCWSSVGGAQLKNGPHAESLILVVEKELEDSRYSFFQGCFDPNGLGEISSLTSDDLGKFIASGSCKDFPEISRIFEERLSQDEFDALISKMTKDQSHLAYSMYSIIDGGGAFVAVTSIGSYLLFRNPAISGLVAFLALALQNPSDQQQQELRRLVSLNQTFAEASAQSGAGVLFYEIEAGADEVKMLKKNVMKILSKRREAF